MNAFLDLLVAATILVGGIFLLLPTLTRNATSVVLWRPVNLTLGRLIGLVLGVTGVILLYRLLT